MGIIINDLLHVPCLKFSSVIKIFAITQSYQSNTGADMLVALRVDLPFIQTSRVHSNIYDNVQSYLI
jgi:hypothetical protein